jgi:phage repressor protein C with HTH and peptisase S24 domain
MKMEKEEPLMVAEKTAIYGKEDNYIFIPHVSGKISAGGGLVPDNAVELRLAFRRDWIQRHGEPQNMSLIRVSGDSMEPTLYSGDIVLVDHNRNYIDPQGGIYAIAMDDVIMIKRLQVIYPLKKIRIISDNPKYEPLEAETEQIVVNGKVIWFGREIEK